MTGEPFISYPDTSAEEGAPFVESLRRVPKTGLHNPLKHPERYNMYGAVSAAVAEEMRKPEARHCTLRRAESWCYTPAGPCRYLVSAPLGSNPTSAATMTHPRCGL